MKKISVKFVSFAICLLMVLSLTACGNNAVKLQSPNQFDKDHPHSKLDTFTAAENDRYQLIWDNENLQIKLYDKANDVYWYNVPEPAREKVVDENGVEKTRHPKLNTSFILEYIETENYQVATSNAYTAVLKKNKYTIDKIKDGFKITYYFDSLEITVPIEYTLHDGGFSMRVVTEDIQESGKALIYRVLINPFLCSVANGSDKNNYLFVPSGNGALMYADFTSEVSLQYSENVYGGDKIQDDYYMIKVNNSEDIKLPVYGAKMGDKAMCAIITDGAEAACIDTDMANNTIGYSAVYSAFRLRSEQNLTTGRFSRATEYSTEITTAPMAVSFYPLYGDKANYSGMAETYRNYLINKYSMKKNDEDIAVSVKLLGGTRIGTSFLGIPTTKIFATTTVTDAGNILEDLSNSVNSKIVANLVGFGESGLDIGKVGGNYKIAGNIGKSSEVKALAEKCNTLGIPLSLDYDIIRFNKDGRGLTTVNGGAAISTTYQYTKISYYKLGNGSRDGSYAYFTSRLELANQGNNAIDNAKSMNLPGISFDTLSNYVYCDFRDNKYIANGFMGEDASSIFKTAKDNGLTFMANSPNEYAAVAADYIIDSPTQSDKNYLFDEEVPFYQMVFKGYVPIFTESINMFTDETRALLAAVESGAYPSYTLTNNYDVHLLKSSQNVYSNTLYEDLKEDIVANEKLTAEYYSAIKGATVKKHEILSTDLRKTTFDNGYVVYVNYGYKDADSALGKVPARAFIFGKEAA